MIRNTLTALFTWALTNLKQKSKPSKVVHLLAIFLQRWHSAVSPTSYAVSYVIEGARADPAFLASFLTIGRGNEPSGSKSVLPAKQ